MSEARLRPPLNRARTTGLPVVSLTLATVKSSASGGFSRWSCSVAATSAMERARLAGSRSSGDTGVKLLV